MSREPRVGRLFDRLKVNGILWVGPVSTHGELVEPYLGNMTCQTYHS